MPEEKQVWNYFMCSVQIKNKLMGGVPKNPDLVQAWLDARSPNDVVLERRQRKGEIITPIAELVEEVIETTEVMTPEELAESKIWTGFQSDVTGLFIRNDHIKAHFKDAANVMTAFLGIKMLRSKLADRVYILPERMYLYREGQPLTKADDYWEHAVHVITMRGERSALAR